MFALYKLQGKVWFANIFNKIDFLMALLFLGVMGSFMVMNSESDSQLSNMNIAIIASISLLMVASSAINTFGMSFYEMKESVLLRRIGATEITKGKAVGAFILWGMTSMCFIVGWMFLWVGICQIPFIKELTGGILWVSAETWKGVNWAGFFVAIIITMISFYAIAFFLVSISKNSTAYQMLGTFYFFIIAFLGGAYTPGADRLWMDIISFTSPLGWGTDMMNASLQGHPVFNLTGYSYDGIIGFNPITELPITDTIEVSGWKNAGQIFMPLIYGIGAGLGAAKFFKWD